MIGCTAFQSCQKVEFNTEIEEFVSVESIRDWWSNGVSELSLKTYAFLTRCNIPERLGKILAERDGGPTFMICLNAFLLMLGRKCCLSNIF